MFRPILPKLTEIRALNRSNLIFCLDVTAINPRPANHKSPRLKLSQGDCRDSHEGGSSPINRDPLPMKKELLSFNFCRIALPARLVSEPLSDLRPPALGCI